MEFVEEKKNKKYAGQVVDIPPRNGYRLLINDYLKPMTEEEGDPYLCVFSKSSFYRISLFDTKNKSSIIANIPLHDMPLITVHTKYSGWEIFNGKKRQKEDKKKEPAGKNTTQPLAFTIKISMGEFKNTTPGDLLLRSKNLTETEQKLRGQIAFLERNLNQWPRNQIQINAIQEAIDYYKIGLLEDIKSGMGEEDTDTECTDSSIQVYCPPDKFFKRKFDEQGRNKCYGLSVTCEPGNQYPYKIEIKNYYAPLKKIKGLSITPIERDKSEFIVKYSILLSEGEWLNLLDTLNNNTENTRTLWYPYMRKKDNDNRNILSYNADEE